MCGKKKFRLGIIIITSCGVGISPLSWSAGKSVRYKQVAIASDTELEYFPDEQSDDKMGVPIQNEYTLQISVAAAEAIYQHKSQGTALIDNRVTLLKSIAEHKAVLPLKKEYDDPQESSYLANLEKNSPALRRLRKERNYHGTQEKIFRWKLSCAWKGFCFFKNASQFASDLNFLKGEERTSFLKEVLPQLPGITHPEFFRIYAAFSEREKNIFRSVLIEKVFTRMALYPKDIILNFLDEYDVKIIVQELIATGNPLWMSSFREHPKMKRYFHEFMIQASVLTSKQLAKFLKLIPTEPLAAENEKFLLPLRDMLRIFSGYPGSTGHEWTAYDLFYMHVPMNIVWLVLALELTPHVDADDEVEILADKERILESALKTMHNIDINPKKTHMLSPSKRGVSLDEIKQLIESKISRTRLPDVSRVSPLKYAGNLEASENLIFGFEMINSEN